MSTAAMERVRIYNLTAREGGAGELLSALDRLAASVRSLAGCTGVEILQEIGTPERVLFMERWESADAYAESANGFPKQVLADVMAALAEKPTALTASHVAAVGGR
jgi:quinol monooxygenase YgiN